jgi:hypothetical protein
MPAKVDDKSVRNVENIVRDVRNWLAVFKTEYGISGEAYDVLHKKIEDLGSKMAGIKCDASGKVAPDSIRPVANVLRDAKAWLAEFASEYDLADEAVEVLHENFDKIGSALAKVDCKK